MEGLCETTSGSVTKRNKRAPEPSLRITANFDSRIPGGSASSNSGSGRVTDVTGRTAKIAKPRFRNGTVAVRTTAAADSTKPFAFPSSRLVLEGGANCPRETTRTLTGRTELTQAATW